jgi:hypothetical protein
MSARTNSSWVRKDKLPVELPLGLSNYIVDYDSWDKALISQIWLGGPDLSTIQSITFLTDRNEYTVSRFALQILAFLANSASNPLLISCAPLNHTAISPVRISIAFSNTLMPSTLRAGIAAIAIALPITICEIITQYTGSTLDLDAELYTHRSPLPSIPTTLHMATEIQEIAYTQLNSATQALIALHPAQYVRKITFAFIGHTYVDCLASGSLTWGNSKYEFCHDIALRMDKVAHGAPIPPVPIYTITLSSELESLATLGKDATLNLEFSEEFAGTIRVLIHHINREWMTGGAEVERVDLLASDEGETRIHKALLQYRAARGVESIEETIFATPEEETDPFLAAEWLQREADWADNLLIAETSIASRFDALLD